MHPSMGLVPSTDYDRPSLSPLTISNGPLSRHVRDAAIALEVLAGPDGRDYHSLPFDPPDLLTGLDAGVDGLRMAWTGDYGFTGIYEQAESPRVIEHVRQAALGFSSLGASVEGTDETWVDFFDGFMAAAPLVMMMAVTVMAPPSVADWTASLDARQRNWEAFRRVFGHHDLLLTPTSQLVAWTVDDWDAAWTTGKEAFAHGVFGPGTYTSHTHLQNWLGFPAVSVPCGFVDGLPVGLQICSPPGSEARIFRAAAAFQAAFPHLDLPPVS